MSKMYNYSDVDNCLERQESSSTEKMLMFNTLREGEMCEHSIFVLNSVLVLLRNCRRKPHIDLKMGAYRSAPWRPKEMEAEERCSQTDPQLPQHF